MENKKPVLYIFSGLPGSGKSTLAKNISNVLKAVYLRIDTIEQGLVDLCNFKVQGEGYRLAHRIIEDNLKIGNSVVSDQCNPWDLTRHEFNNIAIDNNCKYINIEIICSNKIEYKNRIEKRKLNTWEDVIKRENDPNYYLYYKPWEEEHIIIDTANKTIEKCTKELLEKINNELNKI
ncbi:AAA family ATPase [Stenoxybacter acetivorans]|uniref:AAA family ATPase n=1 Tax=Stenoxybacter acetivorans TaxID=422441 RepID=UPI00055DC66D|nr:AAA family ATPase [Stenoxybacter acetivorans]